MNKILPNETEITGNWVTAEGRVVEDAACQRIAELVRTCLLELGRDSSGWDALYRDPSDGRLWELIYPQSHLQGGGPPQLLCLSIDEARHKYGSIVPQ